MLEWLKFCVRAANCAIGVLFGLAFLALAVSGDPRAAVFVATSSIMVAGSILSWPRRPNSWRRDPPSDRQIAYATSLGLFVSPEMSKGEVSDMISRATGR